MLSMRKEDGRREGDERKNPKNFSYQSIRVGEMRETTLAIKISMFTKVGREDGETNNIRGVNYMS